MKSHRGEARGKLAEKLRVPVRWFHLPVVLIFFLFCFYLTTAITSLLIPLDVALYGRSDFSDW